jgi:hypothetical protein
MTLGEISSQIRGHPGTQQNLLGLGVLWRLGGLGAGLVFSRIWDLINLRKFQKGARLPNNQQENGDIMKYT